LLDGQTGWSTQPGPCAEQGQASLQQLFFIEHQHDMTDTQNAGSDFTNEK